MKLSHPTRNQARSILLGLVNDNLRGTSIKELCTYCILCFEKKHNVQFVTFVFTNAMVDMFPEMSVEDENHVDTTTILLGRSVTSESIDNFFINCIGETLESFIENFCLEEQSFIIQVSNSGPTNYNPVWFNNADKFVLPLLASYQEFKQRKGMLFQVEDILQIPIDYAIVISYNHFIQNGFLNKEIISSIIKTFTDAANNCLNGQPLNYTDIEYYVLKDILKPNSVKAAFEFIRIL